MKEFTWRLIPFTRKLLPSRILNCIGSFINFQTGKTDIVHYPYGRKSRTFGMMPPKLSGQRKYGISLPLAGIPYMVAEGTKRGFWFKLKNGLIQVAY